MKTPRFFITLALCAIAFTITSSSLECAFRVASAQTLPVLRVNPWAGDPEEPKGPMEMPLEEGSLYVNSGGFEYSRSTTISTRTSTLMWHSRNPISLARMILFGFRW